MVLSRMDGYRRFVLGLLLSAVCFYIVIAGASILPGRHRSVLEFFIALGYFIQAGVVFFKAIKKKDTIVFFLGIAFLIAGLFFLSMI